jgi:hypothetical protein
MNRFLNDTINDMRGGRETWRVFVALAGPAFTLAFVLSLLQF